MIILKKKKQDRESFLTQPKIRDAQKSLLNWLRTYVTIKSIFSAAAAGLSESAMSSMKENYSLTWVIFSSHYNILHR